MLTDSELVRKVLGGDKAEFGQLVSRHQRSALALAYRILGNWDDAEDAAQDAFVRAFKGLRKVLDNSPFWPWFRKIVINCCLRRLSRAKASVCIDSLPEAQLPFVDSPEGELLRRADLDTIRSAIADLPSESRTVIILRYQEGLSTSETAAALGVSDGAVRVRLHRALRGLANRLGVLQNELRRQI